ncbi:MAG: hypothetical protein J7L96_04610, partial [Bacteroidales bacterium]|nr:hypothetical protein [Bacteroidales bacterium]
LGSTGSWVFLPVEVIVETSSDGKVFHGMGRVKNTKAWDSYDGAKRLSFTTTKFVNARYLRVTAKSLGQCPKGHAGEGGKAWLFCDEITVE